MLLQCRTYMLHLFCILFRCMPSTQMQPKDVQLEEEEPRHTWYIRQPPSHCLHSPFLTEAFHNFKIGDFASKPLFEVFGWEHHLLFRARLRAWVAADVRDGAWIWCRVRIGSLVWLQVWIRFWYWAIRVRVSWLPNSTIVELVVVTPVERRTFV